MVEGNRVTSVGTATVAQPDDITIDASGMFLMPGMVEGHAHLSFENVCATEDLITPAPKRRSSPPRAGQGPDRGGLYLCLRRLRGEAETGRRRAGRGQRRPSARPAHPCGRPRNLRHRRDGDESKLHNPRIGPSAIVDGVEEMRKTVRLHCREGIDNVKLDVSGDPFYPGTPATRRR